MKFGDNKWVDFFGRMLVGLILSVAGMIVCMYLPFAFARKDVLASIVGIIYCTSNVFWCSYYYKI